jgi:hypothetical protein
MDRRGFLLTSLAGAIAAPLAAEAQSSTRIARIGLLTDLRWEPLRDGLRDLGRVEGRNIVFELRKERQRRSRPNKRPRRFLLSWSVQAIH